MAASYGLPCGGGWQRKCALGLGVFDGGGGGAAGVHERVESVAGLVEALVGFGVALLGVLQVGADFLEIFGEGVELLAQAVEVGGEVLGVFLDLHAAQAHGDDAQVGMKGVRRNGKDAAAAAVFVEGLAFAVHAH